MISKNTLNNSFCNSRLIIKKGKKEVYSLQWKRSLRFKAIFNNLKRLWHRSKLRNKHKDLSVIKINLKLWYLKNQKHDHQPSWLIPQLDLSFLPKLLLKTSPSVLTDNNLMITKMWWHKYRRWLISSRFHSPQSSSKLVTTLQSQVLSLTWQSHQVDPRRKSTPLWTHWTSDQSNLLF